ncbi:sugar transferase [Nocardioides sp. CF8]|uniref:sugar transferase n=1 Tax=Nocardioides sp. CF8 TaxID=110319 RepID=UPI00032E545C|nr:sugar transferase [Nocardioides sp. CF8]EON22758.1 sugar transferase [Nocardioides sp. CF8]
MPAEGLSRIQSAQKRSFDVALALVGLVVTSPLCAVAWLVATASTRRNGIFRQTRIGRHGEPFTVLKIRTMRAVGGTTVTTANDARITRAGAAMRRLKVDELPQLINVLRGDMSLVGPRPDVSGFADELHGSDRIVLSVRPGITGPAAIAYRHEEDLLASAEDPEAYNRDVIWPDKVRINRAYVENWSLAADIRCISDTIKSVLTTEEVRP